MNPIGSPIAKFPNLREMEKETLRRIQNLPQTILPSQSQVQVQEEPEEEEEEED